jgi:peptidoglycan/LPS O-acetylase OafA/YrhL
LDVILYIPADEGFRFHDGMCLSALFLKTRSGSWSGDRWLFIFSALELGSILWLLASVFSTFMKYSTFQLGLYYLPPLAAITIIFAFQRGAVSRLLSNHILAYWGKLSFSIYMIHQLVIWYIFLFFGYDLIGINVNDFKRCVIQLIVFAVIVALSDVCYRYFEDPLRAWLSSRSRALPLTMKQRV